MRFHLKADQLPNYSDFEDLSPSYDTAKAQAELDALTEDEKGKLAAGVAVAVGNEQALPYLGDAANAAANAVRNIDEMFVSLRANLVSLGVDTERFLQDFDAIKTSFRGVVYDSQQLAIKIAQYGESFDSVVVKFCADSSLSVERRIQKIEQFIAESDGFKKDAESMRDRFDNLKDNFSGFVGSFSSWAQDQEKLDNERIQKLYKEIDDLNEEIGKLDSAIYALGAGLAATLPITGIVSVAFPPFAPIIMAVGCVLAGLELTSMVGLLVAKNSLLNQKRGKENEIKRLQNEITKIQATRTQLEKSGMEDLAIFTTNVTVLSQVWTNVINDAAKIRGWLEDGAKDADIPEYMKLSLDEGAAVYKNMAHYLENYANGVAIQKLMGGKLGKRI